MNREADWSGGKGSRERVRLVDEGRGTSVRKRKKEREGVCV
jgi:hypothetical protein